MFVSLNNFSSGFCITFLKISERIVFQRYLILNLFLAYKTSTLLFQSRVNTLKMKCYPHPQKKKEKEGKLETCPNVISEVHKSQVPNHSGALLPG